VRVLTGLLTSAEYGELALGMTLAILVGQTLFGPLGQGATRFYAPAVEKSALNVFFNNSRFGQYPSLSILPKIWVWD